MDENKVLRIIPFEKFMKYIRNKRVWVIIGYKENQKLYSCIHMVCYKIKDSSQDKERVIEYVDFFGKETHIELNQKCLEVRQIEARPNDKEKMYEMIFENAYVIISEEPEKYGH